jgi:hypothetical protein
MYRYEFNPKPGAVKLRVSAIDAVETSTSSAWITDAPGNDQPRIIIFVLVLSSPSAVRLDALMSA